MIKPIIVLPVALTLAKELCNWEHLLLQVISLTFFKGALVDPSCATFTRTSLLHPEIQSLVKRQEKKKHLVSWLGNNHHMQEMRVMRGSFLKNSTGKLCLPQLTWGEGKSSPDLEKPLRPFQGSNPCASVKDTFH